VRPRPPGATYRLQFNPGFGFADATRICDYLRDLGITDVYASPLLAARPGSTHGYDVADPTRFNPELGSGRDADAFAARLEDLGMGLLLDIVPNHMAASTHNPWWNDVLARGRASAFADFFAVDWDAQGGKILLPILGGPYGEVLERGELELRWTAEGPKLGYYDNVLPLDPSTTRRMRESDARELNGTPGDPSSFDALHELLEQQPYRLAWWRTANREVNYRRFFDIGDLISIRQEEPAVFEATHGFVLDLVSRGVVTGLRIDHIDGLRDPGGYLSRLRDASGGAYVVVEKILAPDEHLPEDWPVAGTTGYEFLNTAAAILADERSEPVLQRLFETWTGDARPFSEVVHEAKRQVLDDLFGSDVSRLLRLVTDRVAQDRHTRDLDPADLREALLEVTAWLPVYRTYANPGEMSPADAERIEGAVRDTIRHRPDLRPAAEFLGRMLLEAGEFTVRWQQFTGPAMAKGHEDTALYRYVRLISRNAVGGEPSDVALPVDTFHRFCADRVRRGEASLSATSTHDTKRAEDVRARIDVLTEIPKEWAQRATRWREMNAPLRRGETPSPHEELLLYQTLVGTWPLDAAGRKGYSGRIADYMVKAAREAKAETSWLDPDTDHEQALRGFVRRVLGPRNRPFLDDIADLCSTVSLHGAMNSLAQVVLKIAAPGVPDMYQGTELWTLSLVDPDNRRPVDFDLRASMLEDIRKRQDDDPDALLRDLLDGWTDGRVKLYTTHRALQVRLDHRAVFDHGSYTALAADGSRADHVVAFARQHERSWVVAVVPRLTVRLGRGRLPLGRRAWRDTVLRLPSRAPTRWVDAFTGRRLESADGRLRLSETLDRFPVALLHRAP